MSEGKKEIKISVQESVITHHCTVNYHLTRILAGARDGMITFLTIPTVWFKSHDSGNPIITPEWCENFLTLLTNLGGRTEMFRNFNYDDRHSITMIVFDEVNVEMVEKVGKKFGPEGRGDLEIMKRLNGGAKVDDFTG